MQISPRIFTAIPHLPNIYQYLPHLSRLPCLPHGNCTLTSQALRIVRTRISTSSTCNASCRSGPCQSTTLSPLRDRSCTTTSTRSGRCRAPASSCCRRCASLTRRTRSCGTACISRHSSRTRGRFVDGIICADTTRLRRERSWTLDLLEGHCGIVCVFEPIETPITAGLKVCGKGIALGTC